MSEAPEATAAIKPLIAAEMERFHDDPLGFVKYAFPWGDADGPLAGHVGPDAWQREMLDELGANLKNTGGIRQFAVASGHGIGKGALTAWIAL